MNFTVETKILDVFPEKNRCRMVYASINVKSEGGRGEPRAYICGAFDFSEEVLVKMPTVGPQNLVKSDQISPGVRSIYIENE